MLNPSFSQSFCDDIPSPYVTSESIVNRIVQGNQSFDTGMETRFHAAYGEEILLKCVHARVTSESLNGRDVMEVCAGTGFLTYHLPESSSPNLTVEARHPSKAVEWILGDMHTVDFYRKLNVIIGNGFIHHIHNVPHVLTRFNELLKAGGYYPSRAHHHVRST